MNLTVDPKRVARAVQVTGERFVGLRGQRFGRLVPQLRQRATSPCGREPADLPLHLQHAAAHAFAGHAFGRELAQHAIHDARQRLHVFLAAAEHDREVVAQRVEVAVCREQRGPQPGDGAFGRLCAGTAPGQVEDDL
jgi:hypothetical protein